MQDVMEKIYEYLATYGLNVLAAALIFFIGKWVAGVVANLLEKMMKKTKLDDTLAAFVKNISYVAMLIFVFIAALGKLGVQTTSFIAVIGAAGLAVGLALQGIAASITCPHIECGADATPNGKNTSQCIFLYKLSSCL